MPRLCYFGRMKRMGVILCLMALALSGHAQDEDALVRAAMYIHGVGTEEELELWMIEQLEGLRPVSVNSPGRKSKLILSEYQLAALEDYRSRCGDILSYEELVLVDGFGKEAVTALKPFLSLWSTRAPGSTDTAKTHISSIARTTEKKFGGKLKMSGNQFQVASAARTADGFAFREGTWTAHAELSLRKMTLTIGDFNARYGQGLVHWSGFSMSSLSTPEAFIRRSTGISPVWSFTEPPRRGAAIEYGSGRFSSSFFADIHGTAGAHAAYLWRYGGVGVSLLSGSDSPVSALSVDGRLNYKGLDIACEAAQGNGSFAFKGATSALAGPVRLVFQGRAVPSRFSKKKYGEYGLAAGMTWKSGEWQQISGKKGFGSSIPKHSAYLTVDASLLPIPITDTDRRQLRIYSQWKWQIDSLVSLEIRYTGRYRSYDPGRTDLRADLRFASGIWLANARLEGVFCQSPGFMGYLEGGVKDRCFSAYLRAGAFSTGGWTSRIYCYERDAPGVFNVSAYHGRGISASLYCGWKRKFHSGTKNHLTVKLFIRGGLTSRRDYSPAKTLRLQLNLEK